MGLPDRVVLRLDRVEGRAPLCDDVVPARLVGLAAGAGSPLQRVDDEGVAPELPESTAATDGGGATWFFSARCPAKFVAGVVALKTDELTEEGAGEGARRANTRATTSPPSPAPIPKATVSRRRWRF